MSDNKIRAMVIPAEIVRLTGEDVEEGKGITIKEAWLLATIDSLVNCRGKGCFASEEFLAKRVQVQERQLRNLLKRMIGLKYVIVKNDADGEKYLETAWSRAVERAVDEAQEGVGKKLPEPEIAVKNFQNPVKNYRNSRKKITEIDGKKLPIEISVDSLKGNDRVHTTLSPGPTAGATVCEEVPSVEVDEVSQQPTSPQPQDEPSKPYKDFDDVDEEYVRGFRHRQEQRFGQQGWHSQHIQEEQPTNPPSNLTEGQAQPAIVQNNSNLQPQPLATTIKPSDEQALVHSKALCDLLTRKRKLTAKPRDGLLSWKKEFRLLYNCIGGTDRIDELLAWYAEHVGGEYVPQAYSAKSFREKYPQLISAMDRSNKDDGKVSLPVVDEDNLEEVPGLALKELQQLQWPKGSVRQLPALLQLSWDRYGTFMGKVRYFGPNRELLEKAGLLGFSRDVLFNGWFGPVEYLVHWFSKVCRKVRKWDDWDGDLSPFAFSVEHRWFTQDVYTAAVDADWSRGEDYWGRILKFVSSLTTKG